MAWNFFHMFAAWTARCRLGVAPGCKGVATIHVWYVFGITEPKNSIALSCFYQKRFFSYMKFYYLCSNL